MLELLYVVDKTAAFTIHGELYYLKTGHDYPMLFKANLQKMIVPNLDHWFQAQTHQRYSYQGFKDMMAAYAAGMSHSYTSTDMPEWVRHVYEVVRDVIFRTERSREYAEAYWIELLDPKKLPRLTDEITANFDKMQKQWGDDRLYEYLCRLRHYCMRHAPGDTPVYERLIERLGRPMTDVHYASYNFEKEIVQQIIGRAVGERLPLYKDIPEEIMATVHKLQATKRFE